MKGILSFFSQMYIELIPSKECNLDSLTYSVPEKFNGMVDVGSVVKIPFRRGFMYGLVIKTTSKEPEFKTRPIWDVADIRLNKATPELIEWIADYYFCSRHAAAKLFLPDRLWNHKVKLPKTVWYKLSPGTKAEEVAGILNRSKKQLELIELLETKNMKAEDIALKGFSTQIVKSLFEKGLIQKYEESHIANRQTSYPNHNQHSLDTRKNNFTTSQKKVYESISKSKKNLHLLHGVTGSGKTEIYLHLIHQQLEAGKQALLLLPEIALTPQTRNYFETAFGKEVISVIHSGQTLKERAESWLNIYSGKTKILIGARSALFAPFENLGIIIVDESHDQSYKQDVTPRYNAKRVAAEMAKCYGIKAIYGTATPNVETYFAASKTDGQIELHHIDEKVAQNSRRDIYIVDMKDEWKKKNFSIFSELLTNKIREKLENKEQIILFVNRRGSASSMICRDCGHKENCQNCALPLTYHKSKYTDTLQCHHCGFVKPAPHTCPKCASVNFKLTGLGTEKIEEEIAKLFPSVGIIRADSDTTSKDGDIEQIYETFKSHKADILIGTQMIAKGWDIPNVTLVGIVLADIGLNIPDFRSSERIFQLLTQVAGRTARADKHGEVIIQTYNPENSTIQASAKDDYHEFYENEINDRRKFSYPPFTRIIKLTIADKNQKDCMKKAEEVAEKLKSHIPKSSERQCKIFTTPDYIYFKNGQYNYNIFVHAVNPDTILFSLPKAEIQSLKIDRI